MAMSGGIRSGVWRHPGLQAECVYFCAQCRADYVMYHAVLGNACESGKGGRFNLGGKMHTVGAVHLNSGIRHLLLD